MTSRWRVLHRVNASSGGQSSVHSVDKAGHALVLTRLAPTPPLEPATAADALYSLCLALSQACGQRLGVRRPHVPR